MKPAGQQLRPAHFIYRLAWQSADYLFPPNCGGCGKFGIRWCNECAREVDIIGENCCPKCGEPGSRNQLCTDCLNDPPMYHVHKSWAIFQGPLREALHRLKYQQDIGLGEVFSEPLSKIVRENSWDIDLIMPIPLSPQRASERGYNQAALLSFPLALSLNVHHKPQGIRRVRDTLSQVGLNAIERKQNVVGAFQANPLAVQGKKVLIVDDVATTGSTLNSCASALILAGAQQVYCLTLARAASHTGNDQSIR